MKCNLCSKAIEPLTETFFSVDVYRYNSGIKIDFEDNVIVCESCFAEKYNLEAKRRYYESIIERLVRGEELSDGQMGTVVALMGEDYFEKNNEN